MAELNDRNRNPLYILLTLAGENHSSDSFTWNAWACQGMSAQQRNEIAGAGTFQIETPEWDDETAQAVQKQFAEVWRARNETEDVPDIPHPNCGMRLNGIDFTEQIDASRLIFRDAEFRGSHFRKRVEFDNARFVGRSDFTGVHFHNTADFTNTVFQQRTRFRKTHFDGYLNFWSAKFLADADFEESKFGKRADFSKSEFCSFAYFNHVIFTDMVEFQEVSFGTGGDAKPGLGIDFTAAKFCQRANFRQAKFNTDVVFEHADFAIADPNWAPLGEGELSDTDFFDTRFAKSASFAESKFRKTTNFTKAVFKADVDFRGADSKNQNQETWAAFGAKTLFSSARFEQRADFLRRRFGPHDGRAEELTFANAIFDGPVPFEDATFPHLLPVLTNTSLPPSTKVTAHPEYWPAMKPGPLRRLGMWLGLCPKVAWTTQKPEGVKASAAALRHAMARQMLPEEEHFFFRREMHHAARAEPWYNTAHIYLYEALSNFGYSIKRPLGWIALVWAIGTWVYALKAAMGWGTGAAYSFATMFKFFGFQRTFLQKETSKLDAIPWMETFAAGQTVIGFILLFFLGLGLRTRFRLR